MFHHDPAHSDTELEFLLDEATVPLGRGTDSGVGRGGNGASIWALPAWQSTRARATTSTQPLPLSE